MAEEEPQGEPTMEDILSSIRQIISEDGEEVSKLAVSGENESSIQGPTTGPEVVDSGNVLELTEMVREDGTVVSLNLEKNTRSPEPKQEPGAESQTDPNPMPETEGGLETTDWEGLAEDVGVSLLSSGVANEATSKFASLTNAVTGTQGVPLGNSNQTIEQVVREILRPMLRHWLDKNLNAIVTRAVEREVSKLAGRAEDK